MTEAQIKASTEQAIKIIEMMTASELEWFKSLSEDNQFQFICGALAATAF